MIQLVNPPIASLPALLRGHIPKGLIIPRHDTSPEFDLNTIRPARRLDNTDGGTGRARTGTGPRSNQALVKPIRSLSLSFAMQSEEPAAGADSQRQKTRMLKEMVAEVSVHHQVTKGIDIRREEALLGARPLVSASRQVLFGMLYVIRYRASMQPRA